MNKSTRKDIRKLINECISVLKEQNCVVSENRVVTFGNKTYPNFGWCVFLGGSGGSGKGFALGKLIPINGKVINVDNWKKFYAKMNGMDYDSHNPEQVNQIHQAISSKKWKSKYTDNIFNSDVHTNKDRLPNVIFDMTAKNPYHDVLGLAEEAQDLGYKTMLIWVVATRHEAMIRNLQRDRRIPDRILHDTYNQLMDNMPKFLQGSYAGECLDDAWIIFSSAPNIDRSDLQGEETKTVAVQLQRGQRGFVIDKDTMQRLIQYLGEKEVNPDKPQTYLSSQEVADKYGTPNEKGGYNIDRKKLDLDKKLYR